jgi:transcriptional regulator with XRE-family HTH domain
MRSQKRRTTVIVVGGALAVASVGYGLGTQADDGTAIADSARERQAGAGLAFERGVPPGFAALADELGVDQDELQQALRDFHDQEHADRRDEFAQQLADALGISADKVKSGLDALRQRHEDRFATRLAEALGVDAGKVKDALDKLKDERPAPFGDFAQRLADELGVDASDVRSALMESQRLHGGPHRHRDMPLRQLAAALDVSRADLRAAIGELRRGAADDREQHRQELARFLADRFELDVDKVSDALAETAPPLSSGHRPPGPRGALPDHPPAP